MVGHVGSIGKLPRIEDMKSDAFFNHLKNTTNYQSKTFSFLVVLLLFSQSVTVLANVIHVSQPNDLDHLAPGSEVLPTIQEAILEGETGSSDRSDEVDQVLASGKLKDDISPFVWDKTKSNKTFNINEKVIHRKIRETLAGDICVMTVEELDELLAELENIVHLSPENEGIIQKGILEGETGSSENRSEKVGQAFTTGKHEDVIAPFVWNITTSNKTLKINEKVIHRKIRETLAGDICGMTAEELDELLAELKVLVGHLAPGSEGIIQEGILEGETDSSDYRYDEVGQVLDSDELKDVIAPFVWDKNTSNKPLKINEKVIHGKISDTFARDICVVTDKELNELLAVLENRSHILHGFKSSTKTKSELTSSKEHCNPVVEIKHDLLHLKHTFHEFMSYKTSAARHKELIVLYYEEVQSLERKINDITRNASQEMSRKLVTEYQRHVREMNRFLPEVCILEIKNKGHRVAARSCSYLPTPRMLHMVFKYMYANNVENVKSMLDYLNALPASVEQNVLACTLIYEEMLLNNHLQSTEILMLDNLISETLRMPQMKRKHKANRRFTETLTNLKHAIESRVQYVRGICSLK